VKGKARFPTILGLTTFVCLLLFISAGNFVQSQSFRPNILSTGVSELEVLQSLPSFDFPTNPEAVVLTMTAVTPSVQTTVSYTLYGDGTLERVRMEPRKEPKVTSVELSFEDVQALLRTAIFSGLAETTQPALRRKIRNSQIAQFELQRKPGEPVLLPAPAPPGSATTIVGIHLSSFGDRGPVTNELVLQGLETQRKYNPDVMELVGWAELFKELRRIVEK